VTRRSGPRPRSRGMIEMRALAELIKDDYAGTCEVLGTGDVSARLRLTPEGAGEPVTFEITPCVPVLPAHPAPADGPFHDGIVPESPVELVLVTPCDGSWDSRPVLVSPIPWAILAVALNG
jgi:hypothetical protein